MSAGALRGVTRSPLARAVNPLPDYRATKLTSPGGYQELDLTAATLDSRITFSRASTKTYIGSDGLRHTAAVNEWPVEYDPSTLVALGRRAEESRTNLLLNSDTLATQTVTLDAGVTTWVLSFEGTGSVALSGAYTGSLAGTGDGPANRVQLYFTSSGSSLTVTVTGSVTFAQLEKAGTSNGTASSYISSGASPGVRAVEAIYVADLSSMGFNPRECTVYVELNRTSRTQSYGPSLAASDGKSGVSFRSTTTNELAQFLVNGIADGSALEPYTVGVWHKAAYALSQGGGTGSLAVNGVATSVTTAVDPTPANRLCIGGRADATGFNDTVGLTLFKRIRYYPRRLTTAELAAITT